MVDNYFKAVVDVGRDEETGRRRYAHAFFPFRTWDRSSCVAAWVTAKAYSMGGALSYWRRPGSAGPWEREARMIGDSPEKGN